MDSEMSSQNDWRGCPISDIIGSTSPWGAPEFPLVTPSTSHTVLYRLASIGERPPKPFVRPDRWDGDHVRMPCSSKSLYPVEDNYGEAHLHKRWEMIESALKKPIANSFELAEAILSYNTKFRLIWKFTALHTLFNDQLDEDESRFFFSITLPQIASLALELPELIQAPIPLLKKQMNHSISMTQHQISSLLANAFFCTFPRRNTSKKASEYATYPHINFSSLYDCKGNDDVLEKLKCLCHYFRRVCTKAPVGVMTFSRRHGRGLNWAISETCLSRLPVHVDSTGCIEDAHGLIQVDFANKYLGGGVLGYGSVQEEIRFCLCPELMVSMLFTEELAGNEALFMIGGERYSDHLGYSRTFRWAGDHVDTTPLDSSSRRRTAVLAIDALPYSSKAREFRRDLITRELNKAWIGVSSYTDDQDVLHYPGVATGNWGCGAFGGTPQLKCLIQMMAFAQAGRPMAYFTFGDEELRDEIINVYNLLARYNVTVGRLYRNIVRFATTDVRRSHLHAFIQQVLVDEEKAGNKEQELMETSTTECKQKNSEDRIQKELLDDSPDLFSQDEESQDDCDTTVPVHEHSKAESQEPAISKEAVFSQKTIIQNKTSATTHTSRLFDEMQKFDDENGKLSLVVGEKGNECYSRVFDKEPSSNCALVEHKIKTCSTNEKCEENDTKLELNASVSCKTPKYKRNLSNIPNTSMDCDSSSELKKKVTRKITDYFHKKSV